MIYSMTAFARAQTQGEWGTLVCEIRSINHRFLELGLYLPEVLRIFDMPLREKLRKQLKRGKVECSFRYQPNTNTDAAVFRINTHLAKELCHASMRISEFIRHPAPINPTEILRYPGVIESKEADVQALAAELNLLLDKTLADLIDARAREGEELKGLFYERMDALQVELKKVRARLPIVLKEQHERIQKRFQEARVELDQSRLEQELVMFAQRIDISEEIDRTETHINEVKRVLREGGMVGRRLDFLLQELNREANTLGSKSVDSAITHAAVEMKVLIEQVREQVQNIE